MHKPHCLYKTCLRCSCTWHVGCILGEGIFYTGGDGFQLYLPDNFDDLNPWHSTAVTSHESLYGKHLHSQPLVTKGGMVNISFRSPTCSSRWILFSLYISRSSFVSRFIQISPNYDYECQKQKWLNMSHPIFTGFEACVSCYKNKIDKEHRKIGNHYAASLHCCIGIGQNVHKCL